MVPKSYLLYGGPAKLLVEIRHPYFLSNDVAFGVTVTANSLFTMKNLLNKRTHRRLWGQMLCGGKSLRRVT